MTVRQSKVINDTLPAPDDGLDQLAQVCDDHLLPLVPVPDPAGAAAAGHALDAIRHTTGVLALIAKPFARESNEVSQQVERMYVGLRNLAATDAMASFTRQFRPAPGTAMEALDDAVARLGFDTALTLCHRLLPARAPDRAAPAVAPA
jgi:hypothetical protein